MCFAVKVVIIALARGQTRIVKNGLIGSILSYSLLVSVFFSFC
jgi:Ca2+/H+ antiporter